MTSSIDCINPNAAGIDIGSRSHFVAVPADRAEQPVQEFKFFTQDLHRLADWLKQCKIDTIAMESTGSYWIPLYNILLERGFNVYLVNAKHIKNVGGRKSDVKDCQWIQQLHSYGLLSKSFIPDELTMELRCYMRHRDNLIRQAARQLQLIEKGLVEMNLQLQNVISDISSDTGMRIVRAICNGETNPKNLSIYRDPHCKSSVEIIEKSLEGHYKKEVLFYIKQALATYDHYHKQISECEVEIANKVPEFKSKADEKDLKTKKREGRKNSIKSFDVQTTLWKMLGVNLTEVPGISSKTALTIVSEIGVDVNFWRSSKQFTCWLGLCPNNKISGGKKIGNSRVRRGANNIKMALRMAACGVGKTHTSLGAFFRRLKVRLGTPKAITATAHKLAQILYAMMKDRSPYIEKGESYLDEKHKKRDKQRLKVLADKFGYLLTPKAIGDSLVEVPSTA